MKGEGSGGKGREVGIEYPLSTPSVLIYLRNIEYVVMC